MKTVFRAASLFMTRGYKPEESFQLGLLQPGFPEEEFVKFTSKVEMVRIQRSLNPKPWKFLVANKGLFYKHCLALNLPTPRVYALYLPDGKGYTLTSSILNADRDWIQLFERLNINKFVIKPLVGAYGEGIRIIAKHQNGFMDNTGTFFSIMELYGMLLDSYKFDGFLMQEFLTNHDQIYKLSSSRFLQTVRIITYVDKFGKSTILHAHFKSIVGNNVIDNSHYGMTGNLHAEVSLKDGTLDTALKIESDNPGIIKVFTHPDTGIEFKGFRLPLWQAACNLAHKAAINFLPLRLIGWDIALSPDGVYLIEGNWNTDPPNIYREMDVILAKIRDNI